MHSPSLSTRIYIVLVVIAAGLSLFLAGLIFAKAAFLFVPAVELSILLLWKFLLFLQAIPFGHFRLS